MYKRRTLHNGRLRWFQSFFQVHVKQAYRIIPYDISRLVAINPCSISIKGNDSNSIIVSSNPLSQPVYYCPVNGRFLCEARLVNLPSFSSFTFQNRTLENSGNKLFLLARRPNTRCQGTEENTRQLPVPLTSLDSSFLHPPLDFWQKSYSSPYSSLIPAPI